MPTGREWFATCDGAADSAARLIEIVRAKMRRHHVLHLRNVIPSGEPLDYRLRVGSALGSPAIAETLPDIERFTRVARALNGGENAAVGRKR
jgi:hypothetical protein